MIVYKITNIENNKVYIGQTINSLEARFKQHKTDALNNVLDTHFARAIRYYGPDKFIAEIIDTANSQEELTQKEIYWIKHYNSTKEGYNETDADFKSGGNTYKSKTLEEMAIIRHKISESKMGGKNPHSEKVKCKNINTNEEYHFNSQAEMRDFFNEANHQFISRRCLHKIKCLYKNEWLIAYEKDEYLKDYSLKGQTPKRGTQIKILDLKTNQEYIFPSIRKAAEEMPICGRQRMGNILKNMQPQIEGYLISYLN